MRGKTFSYYLQSIELRQKSVVQNLAHIAQFFRLNKKAILVRPWAEVCIMIRWMLSCSNLFALLLFPIENTHEVVREYVQDPELVEQLATITRHNAELVKKFEELSRRMQEQNIESFDDLVKFDKKGAEALVKLASQAPPIQMTGRNFGVFGITSTGKSTMINRLLGKDVAAVGAGETTKVISRYDGTGYALYDIPGRNDDLTYFTMEYVSFWKGLTGRLVLITATLKEMTRVFRLLDAIHLNYDIVVNKFDLIRYEERDAFKAKIQAEVQDCKLVGVKNIWFVSAENPNQFSDWMAMLHYMTSS